MLKKTDIYNYLDKVQEKAIKSLEDKYEIELKKTIENTLNEPKNHILRDAITSLELHLSEAIKADDVIKKQTGIPSTHAYKHNLKNELFGFRCCRYQFPDGFEKIRIVHAEREEAIRKTKEEYAKIRIIVKNKKTGEQGKTALITLGFDVSYLDKLSTLPVVLNVNEIVIDKSLIFPCGEQGV